MKMQKSATIAAVLFMTGLAACAGNADPDSNSCKLSCSNARPADIGFSVQLMSLNEEWTCKLKEGTAINMPKPVRARYRIVDKRVPNVGSDDESPGTIGQPRSGIIFQPLVSGIVNDAKSNPENVTLTTDADGITTVDRAEWGGVATPKSEWCTDSCGVATIDVWPVCIGGITNTVTVDIAAGAIIPEERAVFTFTGEKLED
jgi:hypothetical protein